MEIDMYLMRSDRSIKLFVSVLQLLHRCSTLGSHRLLTFYSTFGPSAVSFQHTIHLLNVKKVVGRSCLPHTYTNSVHRPQFVTV